MTVQGVDYSFSRPTLAGLRAKDISFVCRYLSYNPDKNIGAPELKALLNGGFGVVFNWENAATDMLLGLPIGHKHATEALRQLTVLKVSPDVPVYFSCDMNVTTNSGMNDVIAYLQGAAQVLGSHRVGVYGPYSVIEKIVGTYYCTWGWQTYAWSNGRISGKANLYQYHNGTTIGGAVVDLDRALKLPFGAYALDLPKAVWNMLPLDGLNLPEITYGADDALVSGYHYVHRLQLLLNFEQTGPDLIVDGVYGDKTRAVIAHLYGGDGKTVGIPVWTDLYGLVK
jgi:hypothetical protein